MPQTRLLIVRHGDSHHAQRRIVGGANGDAGLTDLGREQAARLRDRLVAELPPDTVFYASVLPRAIETAAILAAPFGAEAARECGLCTWHYPPEMDGRPVEEAQAALRLPAPGIFREFEQGNESWAELVTRVGRALTTLVYEHAGRTIVAVGHAETANASHRVFGNQPLLWDDSARVPPTSVTEWITDGDPGAFPPPPWTLARSKDAAHLDS